MATKKKLLQAAAGSAGGAAALNVEDVFSTYLYDGTDATVTVNNGIDLSGEGGLVWLKNRGFTVDGTTGITDSHQLIDTERGASYRLISNTNGGNNSATNYFSSFNSNGFTVGTTMSNGFDGGHRYTSWTFRKAPKFFDVVTYTGDGNSGQTINHNLGSVPAFMIVKRTDSTGNWTCYHHSLNGGSSPESYRINLNQTSTSAGPNASYWNNTAPTSTQFTVGSDLNFTSATFVVYLFAHNDGDGDFGPTGDQDIIKCGSFVQGTSSYDVDLGFEPQWVLIKSATSVTNWMLFDNMRGLVVDGNDAILKANTSAAEENTDPYLSPSATGFTSHLNLITGNQTYIYIAIRRGPMAVPESATDVFDISHAVNTIDTSWPVDLAITTQMSGDSNYVRDRLRGSTTANRTPYLKTDATSAEADGGIFGFDDMTGLGISGWGTGHVHWLWRRAPNYFDVVAYTGAGGIQTINHNLGVKPEAILIKQRTGTTNWVWWFDAFGDNQTFIIGNLGNATITNTTYFNNTAPTDTQITLGFHTNVSGTSSTNYIAYLFASVDGVSKVGSYTGNSSTQNIDCGFSSGARFVLIKRIDSTGDWHLFDTERGIVTGAFDPYLELNTTQQNADAASGMGNNYIEPYSGGFALNANSLTNSINAEYIFYAIA